MAIIMLDDKTRTNLNSKLCYAGLSIKGASINSDDNRWWITLNKGCSTTYNETKIAKFFMNMLGVSEVVLDGKLFKYAA